MAESLTGLAHAKVNLVLEVLGKRDDGYHEIDTILQEIDLADVVTVTPAAEWSLHVSGPRSAGVPVDDTNLALKAAKLLAVRCGGGTLRIDLEKHIPAAGGLGGGASDAAAVLTLAGRLWQGVTADDIQEAANAVGSDEAFFLVGGAARARGRGELVTALPPLPAHDVVLFVPAQTIERKTARMFAAIDRHAFDDGAVAARFAEAPPEFLSSALTFNAFERVAFDLFPWLADLWADLEERTRFPIRLCGAGPCLFWVGREGEGEYIADRATGADCEVILAKTVNRQ